MELTKQKKYLRDGRSPIPEREAISKVMSANKAKNTQPEVKLRKELWKNNIKGYRLHRKDLPGKPDISFGKKKVAIFVNGCFWHRCPNCNPSNPKSNIEFWNKKFEVNKKRDKVKIFKLIDKGWKVITIWECEIKNEIEDVVKTINNLVL